MMDKPAFPYGMDEDQLMRYYTINGHLGQLGFWISSWPLDGMQKEWLAALAENLKRLDQKITAINKTSNTRGRSKWARYWLHRECEDGLFDPGFGLSQTRKQRKLSAECQRQIDRMNERWEQTSRS